MLKKKKDKIRSLASQPYGVVSRQPGVILKSPLLVNLNSSLNEINHIVKNLQSISSQLFLESPLKT